MVSVNQKKGKKETKKRKKESKTQAESVDGQTTAIAELHISASHFSHFVNCYSRNNG